MSAVIFLTKACIAGIGAVRKAARAPAKKTIARRAALLILLACSCSLANANAAEPEPQIIINTEVTLPAGFSNSALRSIFFGRMQTWPDGTPVTVFVLPDTHPLHLRFCTLYLKTFPYVLKRQWNHLTFTGSGVRPIEVGTTYNLYERVRTTPGAIGYINRLPGNTSDVKFVGSEGTSETERTIRF